MWDTTSTSRIYSGWFWLPDHTDEQMTAALSCSRQGKGPHLEGKGSTSTKSNWWFFSGSGQIVYENIWKVLVWRMVISPENIENTALLFIIFHMNSHKSGYEYDTSPNINWQTNLESSATILCKSISSCYLPCISPLYHRVKDFLPVFLWQKVLFRQSFSPSNRKPLVLRAVVPAVRWIDTWDTKCLEDAEKMEVSGA